LIMASAPQEPLSDHYSVRGRACGVFLGMPIVPWVARQALPNVPLTQNDHKHTDTRHPLPDFSLQNTCKFAVQAAAWITALATGATQKNARVLKSSSIFSLRYSRAQPVMSA
jgi:hypothetical protein